MKVLLSKIKSILIIKVYSKSKEHNIINNLHAILKYLKLL
jgi:hypothetical protein